MKKIAGRTLLSLSLLFRGSLLSAGVDQSCNRLGELLVQAESGSFGLEVHRAALEVDESCVRSITTGHDHTEGQRRVLANALSVIGGREAVEVLKELYLRDHDNYIGALLCMAMGSTGSASDVRYLLDSLRSDPNVSGYGSVIENAALSLSILRPSGVEKELKEVAAACSSAAIETSAVWHALKSIQVGELETPQAGTLEKEDEIGLAVLRSNIPGTEDLSLLRDARRDRMYRKRKGSWYLEKSKVSGPGNLIGVSFSVELSADSLRAFVDVGIKEIGRGRSYGYVLRHGNDGWHVRGIWPGPIACFGAQLLLEADGVRHAHARQEAPALARRSLTMRWASQSPAMEHGQPLRE